MDKRAANWMLGGDTGLSSKAIVLRLNGADEGIFYHPVDPSDFGRCVRMLDLIPEYRERLDEMRAMSPFWAILVDHWDELERLYLEEYPTGRAPHLYRRMRELLDGVRQGLD